MGSVWNSFAINHVFFTVHVCNLKIIGLPIEGLQSVDIACDSPKDEALEISLHKSLEKFKDDIQIDN